MRLSGLDAQLMATSRVPRKRQNQLTDAGEDAPPLRGGAGRGGAEVFRGAWALYCVGDLVSPLPPFGGTYLVVGIAGQGVRGGGVGGHLGLWTWVPHSVLRPAATPARLLLLLL